MTPALRSPAVWEETGLSSVCAPKCATHRPPEFGKYVPIRRNNPLHATVRGERCNGIAQPPDCREGGARDQEQLPQENEYFRERIEGLSCKRHAW